MDNLENLDVIPAIIFVGPSDEIVCAAKRVHMRVVTVGNGREWEVVGACDGTCCSAWASGKTEMYDLSPGQEDAVLEFLATGDKLAGTSFLLAVVRFEDEVVM